jgi:hypothetical protein
MNGAELITTERQRQIDVEGWTPEHDDGHEEGELAAAACCYAYQAFSPLIAETTPLEDEEIINSLWPAWWDIKWWKPSPDPIRNLVKAGALIAAEIDRLQRKAR